MEFIKDCDVSKLKPYERNPRKNDNAVDAVVKSIEAFGFLNPIIVDGDFHICAGHTRHKAAIDMGLFKVPVIVVPELIGDKFAGFNIADNQTASIAEWDDSELKAILAELEAEDFDLSSLGFDDDDLSAYLGRDNTAGLTDPDAVPQPPEIPITQPGDLWLLGDHRLLCGDATKAEDVARLMDGKKAALGLTSPPYAVGKEYEAGVSFADHITMIQSVADRGIEAIIPGGFFFVNFGEIAAQSHAGPLTGSKRQCLYLISLDYWRIFRERKYELYAQRVWYKPFNRLQQPFWTYHTSIPHYQEWEPIWTWRLPGGNSDTCYDWDVSVRAVWDTRGDDTGDRPLTRHVAAFPVCLPKRAIKAHSALKALIWEPFAGSGTTIIAAEQLNRICYAMEIDPIYCDVAVKRWEEFTGRKAERREAKAA